MGNVAIAAHAHTKRYWLEATRAGDARRGTIGPANVVKLPMSLRWSPDGADRHEIQRTRPYVWAVNDVRHTCVRGEELIMKRRLGDLMVRWSRLNLDGVVAMSRDKGVDNPATSGLDERPLALADHQKAVNDLGV